MQHYNRILFLKIGPWPSPTRQHAITVDSINKCVEVYESQQHVKVGQPPMPIILFCEFANWGNSPRWCSGWWSTRWGMRSVPGFFSTHIIISTMAEWRRRRFSKGESSRQYYLVLASGKVEIKFFLETDHWRRCLIGQAGDVFMWRSLFSLASSPTSCWGWTSCTPLSTCTCEWSSSFASLLSQNICSGITRQIIIIIILITVRIITITILSTEEEQRVKRL